MDMRYDKEGILLEIPDSEIEWNEELVDAYTEGGREFYFDDMVNSFNIFSEYMFLRMGFKEPTYVQSMIIQFLGTKSDNDKMIQGLRGIGKSMISQLYVLWRLLRDNDEHILVRSASGKRSRNYTTFLLNLIKQTPILQHLSPRNNQRKSTELFDVNGAKASDSPSVLSAGISANVTGLRATLEILDDVESPTNSGTPDTRQTLKEQIDENINLLVESEDITGEVIVLGTFQSSDSVYVPMIQSGGYDVFIVPAEYPEINDWYSDKLAPFIRQAILDDPSIIGTAVDTRFNEEVLKKRRLKLGRSTYELHYMLNPLLQDDLKFPLKLKDLIVDDIDDVDNPVRYIYSSEEKMRGLKHRGFPSDYFTGASWKSPDRLPFDFTTLAIDPSGRGADETGYCITSIMGGKIFLRDFGGMKGGYEDDTLLALCALAMKYKVNKVKIESNFGDGAFSKMMSTKLIELGYNVEIEDVRAVGQKEVRIVTTLEPLMNQHRIIISKRALEKDFEDKSGSYSFTYQLTHITKNRGSLIHDDIVDVVELGVRDMVEFLARGDTISVERFKEKEQERINKLFEEGLFPELNREYAISNNFGALY